MTRMPSPVKRRYDATRRQQAAARTRAAILEAARELFAERGYAATPMTAIADRAGVALNTVYASVGRKPELARLLIETAISGTGQAIPAEQRDYVQAIRAAPDAGTKIAIYAAAITATAPRMALVLSIIQEAARDEPGLAALWSEIAERRAANMRLFVADLATVAPLRLNPDQAATSSGPPTPPRCTSSWSASAAGPRSATSTSSPTPGTACSWPSRTACTSGQLMPTRPQHEHPIRQINHYGAAPTHHSHMALALITAGSWSRVVDQR